MTTFNVSVTTKLSPLPGPKGQKPGTTTTLTPTQLAIGVRPGITTTLVHSQILYTYRTTLSVVQQLFPTHTVEVTDDNEDFEAVEESVDITMTAVLTGTFAKSVTTTLVHGGGNTRYIEDVNRWL